MCKVDTGSDDGCRRQPPPVSESTTQLPLAALGAGGTLAAAILTQVLQKRAERERRTAEDLRRWHEERFRVAKELLYKIKESERILWA